MGCTVSCEWGWNNYPRAALQDFSKVGKNFVEKKGYQLSGADRAAVQQLYKKESNNPNIEPLDIDDDLKYRVKAGEGLLSLWGDPTGMRNALMAGKGNYSVMMGMIASYSYSLRDDGGYDCEITLNNAAMIGAALTNDNTKTRSKDKGKKQEDERKKQEFYDKVD